MAIARSATASRGVFAGLSILVKLLILAAITLAAFGAVFLMAAHGLKSLSGSVEEMQQLQGGLARKETDLQNECYDAELLVYHAAMSVVAGASRSDLDSLTALAAKVGESQSTLSSMLTVAGGSDTGVEEIKGVVAALQTYTALLDNAGTEMALGKASAAAYLAQVEAVFAPLRTSFDALTSAIRSAGTTHAAMAKTLSASSALEVSFVFVAAMVLIALLTLFTVRSITHPMASLVARIGRMRTGDLTGSFLAAGRDEISTMSNSVDALASDLRALIATVKDRIAALEEAGAGLSSTMEETGAAVIQINSNIANTKGQLEQQSAAVSEVSTAIEQLARSVDALTHMIGSQGDVIAQSSASVEQIIASIESVAANAQAAVTESDRNLEESGAGKAQIDEVSESVASIVRYAENLGEAAKLITEIADRTNLLAMNAAIEAAHAGESGKGFSVVADEIRKLAEQSTIQAKDISSDLGRVATAIEQVRGASGQAVGAFAAILERARGVGNSVRMIGDAMAEQRVSGKLVLEGLGRLRGITKEIERGSEEMAGGNGAILEQVEKLRSVNMMVVQNNEEITRGTKEINDAIAMTMELSARNAALIQEVRGSTDRFTV